MKILLVEDNLADVYLIEEILSDVSDIGDRAFELNYVQRLSLGLELLTQVQFDIILLDLSLPDSQGLETLTQIKSQTVDIPIIVLTALNDKNMAIEAVRQGAQDYLVKGGFQGELLVRAMHYAIERQHIEKQFRQQAAREKLMGSMLERIRQTLDLNEILQTTVAEVRQFLNTDRVLICRCDSQNYTKILVESTINHSNVTWDFNLFLQSLQKYFQALEDLKNPNLDGSDYLIIEEQIKAFLTIPIWQSPTPNQQELNFAGNTGTNKIWGMLVAQNYDNNRCWQTWEIKFLQQLANQVSIGIQQSELYHQLKIANQKLHELAALDGLTGVANRRTFNKVINYEWQRLAREKEYLSLVLCDIDFFKLYNDSYGHLLGDYCLQKVAEAIQKSTKRPADLVARYGGEEFALILPNTDLHGAKIIAENILRKVSILQITHEQSQISKYITVSVGIATEIPNNQEESIKLIEAADQALYQAKAGGRNRIVEASSSREG